MRFHPSRVARRYTVPARFARRWVPVLAAVAALAAVEPATAAAETAPTLRIVGSGKKQALDPTSLPDLQRRRYELFSQRCTKCHPMTRPLQAILTQRTPVSRSPFTGDYVKKYVVKMMRKPNSGISKEDAKEIILFLWFALELAHPESAPVGAPD